MCWQRLTICAKALQGLLDEFFTLQDDGWHNERCDIELAAYLKNRSSNLLLVGRLRQSARAARSLRHLWPVVLLVVNLGKVVKVNPVQRTLNGR